MDRRILTNGEGNAARQPRALPTAQVPQSQMVDGALPERRRLVRHETNPSLELLHWSGGSTSDQPRESIPVIDLTRDDDDDDEDEEDEDDQMEQQLQQQQQQQQPQQQQQEQEQHLMVPDLTQLSYDEWVAMGSDHNRIPINTGLRPEQISGKMRRYKRFRVPNGNRDDEICGICLEDCDNGEEFIGELDYCSHEFHYPCITNWLKQKNSCPLCKRTALSIQPKNR